MAKTANCPHCGGMIGVRYDQDTHNIVIEAAKPLTPAPEKTEDDIFSELLAEDESDDETEK